MTEEKKDEALNGSDEPSDTLNDSGESSGKGKLYDNISIEHKEGSEVEITGEIPVEVVESYRTDTLKRLAKNADIDGFRKGNVPPEVLAARMGENELLQDIAQDVLAKAYPEIVIENKIDVIGRPAVSLTKLAPGNPIGFTFRSAVMPEVKLPDYKKIAEEHQKDKLDPKEFEATEEDLTNVVNDIRMREAYAKYRADNPDDATKQPNDLEEKDWPEFSDEMSQKLGDFKNVDDFKTKIKENISKEKEYRAREQKRAGLADKLVAGAIIDIPEIFVESELEKMMQEFKTNVARMGLEMDMYLQKVDKTEHQLRGEWRPDAEKRAKLQLTLNEIAKKESITPNSEKVERDVQHILEHYQDADPDSARTYVESVMTNDLVFSFLEGEEEKKEEKEKSK